MIQVRDSLTVFYSLIHYEIPVTEEERPRTVPILDIPAVSQDLLSSQRQRRGAYRTDVPFCSKCFQQPLQFLSCCDRPFQSWPGRGLGGLVNQGNSLRVARLPHSPGKYIPTKKIFLPFYVSSLVGSTERPY